MQNVMQALYLTRNARGLPASARRYNKLGYSNVIITDSHQMASITDHYTSAEAAVAAIAAGCDMVLMPEDLQEAFDGLKAAVEDGTLTEARIDESVRRILTVKAAYGLLKD